MAPFSSDSIVLDLVHESRSVDLDRLRGLIERVLEGEGARPAGVSVVLAGHDTVRRLNRDYLGHDYDTDVLSFSLRDPDAEADAPDFPDEPEPDVGSEEASTETADATTGPVTEGRVVEGEVYVDLDTAAERHAEFDASFEEEVSRYVVHGVLHLCGYDDATEEGNARMRRLEDRYLSAAPADG